MNGNKDKRVIEYRLPLFGQIEVTLCEESKILYELLDERGETERLKQMEHLGVLHEVFDCPIYTRWAYVVTILYLIEQAKPFIKISNNVKLKEINISSGEELLKCWALLLFTGHLHGTFSTERALLKKLKEEDYDKLFKKLFEDDRLRENLKKIVDDEKLFHVFYILTAYKTLKMRKEYYETHKEKKEKKGELHENELLEIFKAFLLKENYYSEANRGEIEKREKLKRLAGYFKSFRELAFVILDGYYAQVSLNLNPLYITKHLDEMTDEGYLRTLIDDIQKYFYNTIYHSQEGITNHLFYSNLFLKLFNKNGDTKQLIEYLCNNNNKIDKQELMKENKNQYKHFIRVKFREDEINGFLTQEKEMLNKSGLNNDDEDILFGITFNPPTNEYYGDICCKNLKKNLNRCVSLVVEEVKKFKEENIYYISYLYLKSSKFEDKFKKLEEMKDVNELADVLEVKETPELFFKLFLNQFFNYKEPDKDIFERISSDIEPLSKLYKRREPIACELTKRVFELANSKVKNKETKLEFMSKPSNNLKAFFAIHYKELKPICEYLENITGRSDGSQKNELKSLIHELKEELKREENKNFYYIVIPSMKWYPTSKEKSSGDLKKGELDGLYIKIPKEANKKAEMVIIEAKKRGNPDEKQIKRIRWFVEKETTKNMRYAEQNKQALGRRGYYKSSIKRVEENDCRYIRFPFTI